jgi:ATP-dependent DNA ligase
VIRSFCHDHAALLCAFDVLEIDGRDTRRLPIELRKAGLAQLLHKPSPGIAFNEHHVDRNCRHPGNRFDGSANIARYHQTD